MDGNFCGVKSLLVGNFFMTYSCHNSQRLDAVKPICLVREMSNGSSGIKDRLFECYFKDLYYFLVYEKFYVENNQSHQLNQNK